MLIYGVIETPRLYKSVLIHIGVMWWLNMLLDCLRKCRHVLQMRYTGWDTGVSLAVCQTRLALIKDMAVLKCRKIGKSEHGLVHGRVPRPYSYVCISLLNTRACPATVYFNTGVYR